MFVILYIGLINDNGVTVKVEGDLPQSISVNVAFLPYSGVKKYIENIFKKEGFYYVT